MGPLSQKNLFLQGSQIELGFFVLRNVTYDAVGSKSWNPGSAPSLPV